MFFLNIAGGNEVSSVIPFPVSASGLQTVLPNPVFATGIGRTVK
jgi:hypothetical protein